MTSWESEADDILEERRREAERIDRVRTYEQERRERRAAQLHEFDVMVRGFVAAAASVGNPGARGGWLRSDKEWFFDLGSPREEGLEVSTSGRWVVTDQDSPDEEGVRFPRHVVMRKRSTDVESKRVDDPYFQDRMNRARRALTTFMIDNGIPLPKD